MTDLGRRSLLTGSALALGSLAVPGSAAYAAPLPTGARTAPGQLRSRLSLPSGVQSGDTTVHSAVVWARSSGEGRLAVRLRRGGRVLRGPLAGPGTDFTARLPLRDLPAGREFDATVWFESGDGTRGQSAPLHFATAPRHRGPVSFVWTGDTAGQGWGINPDLGGMVAYRAMHHTRPDFFLHSGDTVYSDSPIKESVVEADGQVWRNLVTPEVSKVAESLNEFRGRHRYNLMDDNLRSMYADVPVIAQWDDHETHNNWYPGQVLTDPAYGEKRVDVLAHRARQAWQEYQPIDTSHVRGRGRTGFAEARIYRKISRGPHLDVFCLDMRSWKDPNTAGTEPTLRHILGTEQAQWLVRELRRSKATWKVVANDLPLGLVVPDGAGEESLSNGDPGEPLGKELEIAGVLRAIKRHRVRNVVWLTADVHYTAAHHYHPERAAFTDFDPFWEFVAGPVSSGAFGPNQLDGTFGPEVVFSKTADYPNQSPRGGNQFFGHVDIGRHGLMTVSLRDLTGKVLHTQRLEPHGH